MRIRVKTNLHRRPQLGALREEGRVIDVRLPRRHEPSGGRSTAAAQGRRASPYLHHRIVTQENAVVGLISESASVSDILGVNHVSKHQAKLLELA